MSSYPGLVALAFAITTFPPANAQFPRATISSAASSVICSGVDSLMAWLASITAVLSTVSSFSFYACLAAFDLQLRSK